MITELTDEQLARIPEFIDKWTRIGLCCEPADREAAERGIRKAYEAGGVPGPEKIIWSGSPRSQGLSRASSGDSVGQLVRRRVQHNLREHVGSSLQNRVAPSAWMSVHDARRKCGLEGALRSIGDGILNGFSLNDWRIVQRSVEESIYSQNDAVWLLYWDYAGSVLGLEEQVEPLRGLMEVVRSAGWCIPFERVCFVSERHNVLHLNGNRRLHFESGPALEYPDGFAVWSLDGAAVDEQIVLRPESQTVEQINADGNIDRKAVRIERFGWPRYLKESGAEVVDTRKNEIENTIEALCRMESGEQRLLVTCPTQRQFALGVPPDVKTCQQAQEWLAGGMKEYRVLART